MELKAVLILFECIDLIRYDVLIHFLKRHLDPFKIMMYLSFYCVKIF